MFHKICCGGGVCKKVKNSLKIDAQPLSHTKLIHIMPFNACTNFMQI